LQAIIDRSFHSIHQTKRRFNMTIPARLTTLVAIAIALLVAGCGGGNKRRPVSGTITFKGHPLDEGHVTFVSTTEPIGPVAGAPIRNGKFEIRADMGIEPGMYRVLISSPKGVGERTPEQIAAGASIPAKEQIPPEYNTESKLTVEITRDGPNTFTWKID
jgi:hypothetical protein